MNEGNIGMSGINDEHQEPVKSVLVLLEHLKFHEVSYKAQDENLQTETGAINALDSKSWECIDGRYKRDVYALRYPGGSAGLLMTVASTLDMLGVGFEITDLQKIFEKVMGPVRYHSDDHHLNDSLVCEGCGHLHLEHEYSDKYHVHAQWIDEIFKNTNLKEDEKNGRAVILTGEHSEKMILKYTNGSEKIQLPPSTFGDGISFFIYHAAVAEKTMQKILKRISEEWGLTDRLEELNDKLKEVMEEHVSVTTDKLAKGLPVLDVENLLQR